MSVDVKITEEEYKKCLNFAEEVSKTTGYYGRSNGSSLQKQINDHAVSKICEIAVESYLRSKRSSYLKIRRL